MSEATIALWRKKQRIRSVVQWTVAISLAALAVFLHATTSWGWIFLIVYVGASVTGGVVWLVNQVLGLFMEETRR